MNTFVTSAIQKLGLLAAGLLMPVWALANDMTTKYNLRTPASGMAEDIYGLHNFLLIVCLVIFVVVFGVMFYSMWKHRKSVGHKSANFHESVKVEIAWTVVPFIIVILMALPATKPSRSSPNKLL